MDTLVELSKISLEVNGVVILQNISFKIEKGQGLVVQGKSGSGKTSLGKIIAGLIAPTEGELIKSHANLKIVFIPQQHSFRNLSQSKSFYQQRYESANSSDFPLVTEIFKNVNIKKPEIDLVFELLGIKKLLDRKINSLSNGEGKRVQLAEALLENPDILILDNPFIGLDSDARTILTNLLGRLIQTGTSLVILSSTGTIAFHFFKTIYLEKGSIQPLNSDEYDSSYQNSDLLLPDFDEVRQYLYGEELHFEKVVEMKNVTVVLNEKNILSDINWTVMKGDKWSVSGPNGAGKSTLLSLILGDNPQIYKNDITLFDKKSGQGQSIWDIKKQIGFISPELHIFFQRNSSYTEKLSLSANSHNSAFYGVPSLTCLEAVCSGFNDQIGSSQKITSLQMRIAVAWLKALGIGNLAKECLYNCSLGEQRIVLLARALVKNPPVIILDEPCQGLDQEQTNRFLLILKEIIKICDKTVIYISHYKEEIPDFVNKHLKLENGYLI